MRNDPIPETAIPETTTPKTCYASAMKILVIGRTGQVAQALADAGAERGWTLQFLGRDDVDLRDVDRLGALVGKIDCDAVLNAAAHTAVDQAETDRDAAFAVNADAPRELARAAARKGAPFVHVSTDFVFDGRSDIPYTEDMPAAPLNVYGESKRAGEEAVLQSGANAAILRTSWVFSGRGKNFVRTMLRLGRERGELRVVNDQFGKPTPARAVAEAMLTAAAVIRVSPELGGLYHVAGDEVTSWADFARAIFAEASLSVVVTGIPSADYPTPAKRPAYSVLDTDKARRALGIPPASWRAALPGVVAELTKSLT